MIWSSNPKSSFCLFNFYFFSQRLIRLRLSLYYLITISARISRIGGIAREIKALDPLLSCP